MKQNPIMFAIIGDICGSRFERGAMHNQKQDLSDIELMHEDCHWTDDTVHTIAFCKAILENYETPDFAKWLKVYTRNYPNAGYGGRFRKWVKGEVPGDSFGNGAYMRISPVLWAYGTLPFNERYAYAAASIGCSHNHPYTYTYLEEFFLLDEYCFNDKQEEFRSKIIQCHSMSHPETWREERKNYILEYAKTYKFDATCPGSVPEAIICGHYTEDYINAITQAIMLGGDTDTQACIAGCYYGIYHKEDILRGELLIPQNLYDWAWNRLPKEFQNTLNQFNELLDKIYANA